MFYLTPTNRLKHEIYDALKTHFGDRADVFIDSYGNLMVNVLEGYPRQQTAPADPKTYGGGVKAAMDGVTFEIKISEHGV